MKTKITVGLILALAALAVMLAFRHPRGATAPSEPQPPGPTSSAAPQEALPEVSESVASLRPPAPPESLAKVHRAPAPAARTNKLERLAQIRESFRVLAAGDPGSALRAAKLITDQTERETALLTLVTEWTRGELRS